MAIDKEPPAMGTDADEGVDSPSVPAPAMGATRTPANPRPSSLSVEELQAQLAVQAEETTQIRAALKKAREDDLRKKRRIEEFEAEEEKRKTEQLSESEKLSKRLAELEKATNEALAREQEAQSALRRQRIHREIEKEAERQGVDDPEIVPPLIEHYGFHADIEIDDGGKVVGVKDAMSKLLKAKPNLASGQGKRGTPPRDVNPRRPTGPGSAIDPNDRHRQEASASARYNQF
jgi:hypothetical protein